ncbi:MAG: hypothetical protein ABSH34_22125 [Verrucomicrobiota bacterium]
MLNIVDDQLRVRYDDSHEGALDPVIAARIHSNIQREEAMAFPRTLPRGREQDFCWTLGVIAQSGELHAEVPPQSWAGFVHEYRAASQIQDVANEPCVMPITHGGHNKWGCELRIYVPRGLCAGPRFVLPENVNLVDGNVPGVLRVNSNEFWWFLVERLGFRAGRAQDLTRIESRLPPDCRQSFHEGSQRC